MRSRPDRHSPEAAAAAIGAGASCVVVGTAIACRDEGVERAGQLLVVPVTDVLGGYRAAR
ncbi:hypothetical protein [Actinoallomurus sp. NPDC052274]|uniref:hypothetical protein n=1 Tax=Actinoallomurus sp. NPDC052274 TaxID=3155420 RepID=UPI00344005C9